jgi:hypothetical protein
LQGKKEKKEIRGYFALYAPPLPFRLFRLPMLRARKRLRMKVKEARGREVLVSAKPLFPSCLFYIFNAAAVSAQHSLKSPKSPQLLGFASFERQGPMGVAS